MILGIVQGGNGGSCSVPQNVDVVQFRMDVGDTEERCRNGLDEILQRNPVSAREAPEGCFRDTRFKFCLHI